MKLLLSNLWFILKKSSVFFLIILLICLNYYFQDNYYKNFDFQKFFNKKQKRYYFQISNRPKANRFYQDEFLVDLKLISPNFLECLREYFAPIRLLAKSESSKGFEYGDVLSMGEDFFKKQKAGKKNKKQVIFKELKNFKAQIYKRQKVYYEVKGADLEFLRHESSFIYKLQKSIRQFYFEKLGAYDGAIISSLLMGTRVSSLPADFVYQVRKLGLGHFFAASGFHLLILSLFLFWFFSILKINERQAGLLIIFISFIYAGIAGFSPSIIRAFVMLAAFLLFKMIDRKVKSIKLLFLLALISLVIDPYTFFDLGFQLSYLATLAILLWTKPVSERLSFLPKYINDLVSVTLSVQILLLPLVIYYFHSPQIWSLLANLVFAPVLSLIVVLAFVAAFFLIKPLLSIIKWYFAKSMLLPFINYELEIGLVSFTLLVILFNFVAYCIFIKADFALNTDLGKNDFWQKFLYLLRIALSDWLVKLSIGLSLVLLIVAINAPVLGERAIMLKNNQLILDKCFGQQLIDLSKKPAQNIQEFNCSEVRVLLINKRSLYANLYFLKEAQILILPKLNSQDFYLETILKIVKPQIIITSLRHDSKKAQANLGLLRAQAKTILNHGKVTFTNECFQLKGLDTKLI